MAAITWQNVNGPSLADAARPLEAAQRSIAGGFDVLGNVLKQRENTENANWEQIKKNNTDEFMNKLYQAQGPEGFKRLQDSGELDRMIAANGAQIDQAAARSAMDNRMGVLQDRGIKNIAYNNTMTDAAQEADVRRIGLLTLTDPVAAQAELAAKPELRAAVQLAQGIDSRQQVLKDRVWNETKQQWEVKKIESGLATDEAQRKKLQDDLRTSAAHRTLYGAQTDLTRAQANALAIKAEDAAIDGAGGTSSGTGSSGAGGGRNGALDRFVANSPYDKGDISTTAGKEALYKALKEIGVSDGAKADILANLEKYYKTGAVVGHDEKGNPIRVPLPVSAVIDAVHGSSDNPLAIGWSRRGDDVVNLLDKRFGVNSDGSPNKDYAANGRDQTLIDNMLAVQALRNRQQQPLLSPGPPTNAEANRQALREAARRNTEAQLGKK